MLVTLMNSKRFGEEIKVSALDGFASKEINIEDEKIKSDSELRKS